MRKKFIIVVMLNICLLVFTAWKFQHKASPLKISPPAVTKEDSSLYERNILPLITTLNEDEKFKPKKDFRQGHVTVTSLKNYYEKTAEGFAITLPANTNIPTPAVIKGSIYLSGGFGSKQYYSFDAATGSLKWAINLDDDGPSSPAIADDIIVFNTESCTIFACDLLTGKQRWSYWLGDPLMSMPTIANGIVFTSYPARYTGPAAVDKKDTTGPFSIFPTHVMIAFDLKTGGILWQKWIDSDIMSAPVAKDDLLYVTTFSGALYKVKQKTGELMEAKAIRATSAPVFDKNNELIISRRADRKNDSIAAEVVMRGIGTMGQRFYRKEAHYLDNKIQALSDLKSKAMDMDAGNGFTAGAPATANWEAGYKNIGQSNVATLQSFQGSRSLYAGGYLYNTMGDEIVCTDSAGKVTWKYALEGDIKKQGGYIGTPPVYANGYLVIATLNGEVLVMDSEKGKVLNKYTIKDPVRYQPVVQEGWIFVTTVNSKLYAINTGNPSITGWGMWGGNAARTNKTSE